MIAITETAARKIRTLMAKQGVSEGGLRVGVKGGGCSGLSYTFAWERQERTGDEVFEGPQKTAVKKWQGYPPENLNVVGKPFPSLPEVGLPRFTGKAQYASRVWFRDLLYVKLLTSPHPHARIKNIDTTAAEKMPGVAYVLTHKNVPRRGGRTASRQDPLPQ